MNASCCSRIRAVCTLSVLLAAFGFSACGGGGAPTPPVRPPVQSSCNFQSGGICTLAVDGVARTYELHIPPNLQPGSPLVLMLHGSGGQGPGMGDWTHFNEKADQEGFVAAYPSGIPARGLDWNMYVNRPGAPDDIRFFRQLIATLQTNLQTDPQRVYVTGFSLGGFMSHRVGVELSDVVAAIAPIEGSLKMDFLGTITVPAARAPVSVLMINGDGLNDVVQYCGGGEMQMTSAETTFNYWAGSSGNSCSGVSTNNPLCDTQGPTTVSEKHATGCEGNADVRIYRLLGGEHIWYQDPMNDPDVGPYNPYLDENTGVTTNDIIWKFFVAHPKTPSVASVSEE